MRAKLNSIFAFSYCWQRVFPITDILSALTLFSTVTPHLVCGISVGWEGQLYFQVAGNTCDFCACHCCNRGVSAGRGEACEFLFDQEMCLVMNKYSLQVSLPDGSGHCCPLSKQASSSFHGNLSSKGGTSYQMRFSWVSSELQTTDCIGIDGRKATTGWQKTRANHGNAQATNRERHNQVMTGWQVVTWSVIENRVCPGLSGDVKSTQDQAVVRQNPWPLIKKEQPIQGNKLSHQWAAVHSHLTKKAKKLATR